MKVFTILQLPKYLRSIISRDRRRYTSKDFDLDLTYVTPELIAMSLPARGWESIYRNPITEVSFDKTTTSSRQSH